MTHELTTTTQQALSTYMAKNDDFADVRPQDKLTPRIKLMQMTSPQVADGKAMAGDMVLDSGDLLVKRGGSTLFVPLMHWLSWVEFNPDRNCPKDKRVIDRSVDPNSSLAQRAAKYEEVMQSNGKKAFAVTEAYNFVGLCPSVGHFDTFYLLSFQRASHRVGKGLINKLMGIRAPDGSRFPMFMSMFELSSLYKDEGPEKKYFIPSLDNRKDTPEDKLASLALLVDGLRAGKKMMMDRELEREKAEAEADAETETSAKAEKHF